MHRTFIKLILAATIAVTAVSAKPARADERDVARLLAGIAAVAILSQALKNDDHRRPRVSRNDNYYQPFSPYGNHPSPGYGNSHGRAKLLPGECLRSVETRGGVIRIFGERCLQQNYRFANRLPRYCKQDIRRGGRIYSGYNARCLGNDGYRIAGR